jgi:branched-chain amino acid transport system ATP-binding protein
VRFGGIVALDNVSFDVKAGQICGLIGSNGAGKTMLLNCLSRLYQAGTGTIHFAGERLLQLPHHCVARLGIGRTLQSLALFRTMSVRDNVVIGGHCRCRGGFVANARLPIVGRKERARQGSAQDARIDGNRGCAVERKAGRGKKLPKR